MGLMIHSLELLSPQAKRDYFIYLLDYGWQEPLSTTLRKNFQEMAEWASKNDSAVIMGVGDIGHFDTEVLSWHHINGEDANDLLPAILITKTNPHTFKEKISRNIANNNFSIILIPLKMICKNETDVVKVIKSISSDIENKNGFENFKIQKELNPGVGKAIIKSIILEPNLSGIGFSFNKLHDFLR